MERTWNTGDGHQRWVRGLSLTKILVTLVRPETIAYVAGSHIKLANLGHPSNDVLRVFQPECEGINVLEGNPVQSVLAIGEISFRPRVFVYTFDKNTETLAAKLTGIGDGTEIRSIKFGKKDILYVLNGVPSFTISIWKWGNEQEVAIVESFPDCLFSELVVSQADSYLWIEWGTQHLTFFELQTFTESDVTKVDISLPVNDSQPFSPDHRLGSKYSFDIISAASTYSGDFIILDEYRTLHKVNHMDKCLLHIGKIQYDRNAFIYKIVVYDDFLGALVDDGAFLILKLHAGKVMVTGKLRFASKIIEYFPLVTGLQPTTSFYAITEIDKKIECVMNGKLRAGHNLVDFALAEAVTLCFIEPEAEYLALATQKGTVYILDTKTGNIFCRWKLDYFVCSVASHPLLKHVILGSMDGCAYIMDCTNIKTPKLINRFFYHGEAVIDALAFMCRGKYLLAADSNIGLIFLQFAIPTMDFEFLDQVNLEGTIRTINTPSNYKDKRFQVFTQRDKDEELALVVHNFRIDGDRFEIVASQFLDCTITTMCFSAYKKFLYAFSAENGMGMIPFTDDMNAGSLKEPGIQFKPPDLFPLGVSRVRVHTNRLISFGQDGVVRFHDPPTAKAHHIDALEAIQTHLAGFDGIREGFVSMDGCHLISIGYDNTIVHVQLKAKDKKPIDYLGLQFGTETNVKRMILQQNLYAAASVPHKIKPLGDFELSLSVYLLQEAESYEIHSTEGEVASILEGISEIRDNIKSLMELNDTYEDFEKVPLEEFELDEADEEESRLDFEQNRKMAEALVVAAAEEREEWADDMKEFLYGKFEVKSCTLRGFNYDKEVSNYPLGQETEDFTQAVADVKEERRLEKKLNRAKKDILRLQTAHNTEIKKLRKASRKNRPKKKGMDYTRFPANMRDEMRALFDDLETPESSSSSSSEETEAAQQDDMGFFERLLKKQSIMEDEEIAASIMPSEDKVKVPVKVRSYHSSDDSDEGKEEELAEEEASVPEEEEAEESAVEEEHLHQQNESEESGESGSSSEDDVRGKRKQKNRIFFGRPSRQALEAQGISAKDAEQIEARAEKMEKEQEAQRLEKAEQAKLSKQREIAEMERMRQAAFMDKNNISVKVDKPPAVETSSLPLPPPKSSDSDSDEEEEGGDEEEEDKGPRKHIRVKRKVLVNEVEVEKWMSETDSSDESEDEAAKEVYFEKAMEDYKQKYMSNTQLHRHNFIKRIENGGRGFDFFESELPYYPQMETFSIQQHISQIELIMTDLRKLQVIFNSEFESVRKMKESTVKLLMAKNERIREISDYLGLGLVVEDPESYIWETPEKHFIVTNEEIPIEPYLTAAEKAELERLRLEDEARRLLESKSFRQKAPVVMMDGVLERRREDELKKSVPKPDFMIQKQQWEWNFEDYQRADEYYALVEALEVARSDFRKELESELRKLIKFTTETKQAFDKRLTALFINKMSVEQAVRLEELKIIRLTRQLTRRDFYQRREDNQGLGLRKLQEQMRAAKGLGAQLSARVILCAQLYEEILEKEKIMVAEFRGNILEAGPYMKTFVNMFTKSPRLLAKQDRMQEYMILMIKGLDAPNLRSFAHDHGELGQLVADAIFELDEPIQIPVGCPRSTWDKFCRLRRQRVTAELEAKVTGTELVQLRQVVLECKRHEDEIANDMALILARMSAQKNLKLFYIQNGEMQIVVPQGRMEAQITRATDFDDVLICKTSFIHKLNAFIKTYTGMLIKHLIISKYQHRTIQQIEWRFRKVNLREKHLLAKRKDIATLRVTKDVLDFLRQHKDFRNVQDQRLLRIRRLQELAETFHHRYMDGMANMQSTIQGGVNRFEKDSERKEGRLEKRNAKYNTLKIKCNITNPEIFETRRVERLQMIMRISHMARLYSQFEETIVTLEKELERLYDKTYPYL